MTNLIRFLAFVSIFVSSLALASQDELQLASRLLSEGKYERALKLLQQEKYKDHTWANYSLGVIYMNGHGVNLNTSKAIEYFEIAAAQGNVDAMINMASIYSEFSAERPRFDRSYYWMLRAAQLGEPQALSALASMHFTGQIFPPNDYYGVVFQLLAEHKGLVEDRAFMDFVTRNFSKARLSELKEQLEFCDDPLGSICSISKKLDLDYGYVRTSDIILYRFDKGLFFDTLHPTPITLFFNNFTKQELDLPYFFTKAKVRFFSNTSKPNICIVEGKDMELVWFRNNDIPEGNALELNPKDKIEFECIKVPLLGK